MKLRSLITSLLFFISAGVLPVSAQYKQNISNLTQLLSNTDKLIPLGSLEARRIAVAVAQQGKYAAFIKQLEYYADIDVIDINHIYEQGKLYNTLIVAGTSSDLSAVDISVLQQAHVNHKDVVLCRFLDTDLSSAAYYGGDQGEFCELIYPGFSEQAQRHVAMSLFGGLAITEGPDSLRTQQNRLQYTFGEGSGYNISKMSRQIDAIAEQAIAERATPGLVVMAIKDGQVLFEKAYGKHTYDGDVATRVTDLFDMASISKIVGTTPVIMHLQENKLIDLDSTMGYYLWDVRSTNKKDITLRSVMLHEAGFTPFIPFYKNLKPGDVQRFVSASHQVQLADSSYLRNNYYQEVMWPQMMQSQVKPVGDYVYSDISMYVMKEVAEHISSRPMGELVDEFLYKPIGMKTAGYNPRRRFDKIRIVPTENDTSFRKVLLEGFVHDQGAAMAGGVAGHAGLFATANDLAIYGQLLLNRGQYGGVRYFQEKTVDLFTSKQSMSSRRGLGFDRADADPKKEYPSALAGSSVYGHTGYTGTCIWIDPKEQLIYIFLSNRVHPQVSGKIYDLNIRSRIQDVIYTTIQEGR